MLWVLIVTWVVQSGGVPISNSTNATLPTAGGVPKGNSTNAIFPTGLVANMWPQRYMWPSEETIAELEGIDGEEIEDGDILLELDRNAVHSLWPDINGAISIPYEISSVLMHRELHIEKAFKMISDSTCIRFHKHTNELNYIKLVAGRGCASYVGCRGGAQRLYYSRYCRTGNLVHELMHALGLHHEHTRVDRDRYITVYTGSVIRGREKNFAIKRGNLQDLPYDTGSIMHYGRYYFSADRRPTITPREEGVQIGQRHNLSPLDVLRLNKLYHCEERVPAHTPVPVYTPVFWPMPFHRVRVGLWPTSLGRV